MKLTMTKKWPSVGLAFEVTDEAGAVILRVQEQRLSLKDAIHLRDADGGERGLLTADAVGGGYTLFVGGQAAAHIGGGRKPAVRGLERYGELNLRGRPGARFSLRVGRRQLGRVTKKALALKTTYLLELDDPTTDVLAVGITAGCHRVLERKD